MILQPYRKWNEKQTVFLLLLVVADATATDITWHANEEHDGDPAKTAPRSQKYWDEHGIQRPEYAKTDAEVWRERHDRLSAFLGHPVFAFALLSFVVGMMVGLYFLYEARNMKGERLGGKTTRLWSLDDQALDDKARRARLERFSTDAPKQD